MRRLLNIVFILVVDLYKISKQEITTLERLSSKLPLYKLLACAPFVPLEWPSAKSQSYIGQHVLFKDEIEEQIKTLIFFPKVIENSLPRHGFYTLFQNHKELCFNKGWSTLNLNFLLNSRIENSGWAALTKHWFHYLLEFIFMCFLTHK